MWSFKWLISQVRTATWTSTEPVSPSWRAYCAMISFFFLFWDCHDKLLFFMLYPSGRFGIACYQERVSCLFDLFILPRFHLSVKHLCSLKKTLIWIFWIMYSRSPLTEKRSWDKSPSLSIVSGLSSKTQWLSGLYYADFISFLQPYSTVRRWDDEIEF